MTMRTRYRGWMACGAMALLLAGCQTAEFNPTAGGGGLQGTWRPDNGGYTASFNNGAFTTTALDTGNTISQGSYIAISEREIELNWTSNVTGMANSARCQRPDLQTMNCTDAGGRGFVLRRS